MCLRKVQYMRTSSTWAWEGLVKFFLRIANESVMRQVSSRIPRKGTICNCTWFGMITCSHVKNPFSHVQQKLILQYIITWKICICRQAQTTCYKSNMLPFELILQAGFWYPLTVDFVSRQFQLLQPSTLLLPYQRVYCFPTQAMTNHIRQSIIKLNQGILAEANQNIRQPNQFHLRE